MVFIYSYIVLVRGEANMRPVKSRENTSTCVSSNEQRYHRFCKRLGHSFDKNGVCRICTAEKQLS